MAADTPAPYIDAFFRFYSDGEFDDAARARHRGAAHGPPAAHGSQQWARAHADAFR